MIRKVTIKSLIILNLIIGMGIQKGYAADREERELEVISTPSGFPKIEHFTQQQENFDLQKKASLLASAKQKIGLGLVGVIGTGLTFTLEVFGATGAFWGATDVFKLRDETNDTQFQIAAMAIGGVAFVRYLSIHAFNSQKYKDYLAGINQTSKLGKVVKAFEMPIPAVKTALVEIFCCNNIEEDFDKHSQDGKQYDIEDDDAILLKCSGSRFPSGNGCDDFCEKPQLRDRSSKKKLYECQLTRLTSTPGSTEVNIGDD